jgi:hypothetical protein
MLGASPFGVPVIARSGNWIALTATAHVDMGLHKTDTIRLDIKVTETIPPELGGGTSTFTLHDKLALQGLSELIPAAGSGAIDTATIEPMYSKVDLSNLTPATFTGAGRAIIRSMSSITTKAITATGGDGGTSTATMTLVGGCPGGGPASTGGCNGTAGGKGGTDGGVLGGAGGGGGGGFATAGGGGTGNGAGGTSSPTGDALIATYDGFDAHSANRPGGGGGGGKPTTGNNGGAGGASGGTIELTAGGDISVGAITANGGAGQAGSTVVLVASPGGGGGGGGLVMLRAEGSLTSGPIAVNGGRGGIGGTGNGGAGSPGRVRWDAPSGEPPVVADGTVHRGPVFTLATRVFRAPEDKITLIGTASDRFDVYAINGGTTYLGTGTGESQVMIPPGGMLSFNQVLQQGLSHLCVTLPGGQPGTSEGEKCVDVAFLP